MEAEQLLASMERYESEAIASLPESVRKSIAIRNLAKVGMLVKDNAVKDH